MLPAEPLLPVPFRVTANRQDTPDTRTLELVAPGGAPVPAWRPGQFMMLYAFGLGEIPISISGDPARRETLVHTIRAVGTVSRALCDTPVGGTVGVRGPYGTDWPVDACAGGDLLVVAGGIGLAPVRPVLEVAMAARGRFRNVWVLVGARTPELMLYPGEFAGWRERGLDVRVSVDAAAPGWSGAVGPVTTLFPGLPLEPARTSAFIVGPEIMMNVVVQVLAARGIPRDRLFVSMERNMKCAVGFCGHCQLGPEFICKDGPVFPVPRLEPWLAIRSV